MDRRYGTWLLRNAATAGLAMLAACGGGGGGEVVSTPTPVASATPTPAPTPTTISVTIPAPSTTPTPGVVYDTGEYRATVGAVSMNSLAAYNVGATGSGVTIGIIDSGVDTTSAEFGGRISAASQKRRRRHRPSRTRPATAPPFPSPPQGG